MKKKIIGGVVAAILLIGVIAAVVWFKNKPDEDGKTEIKAADGEEVIYATIECITGNDIEVTILTDAEIERINAMNEAAEQMAEVKSRNAADSATQGGDMSGGGMPDMQGGGMSGGGGMPSMQGGGMSGGGGMPNMQQGGMPGGGGMPNMSGSTASADQESDRPEREMPDMPEGGENGDVPEGMTKEIEESEKASYRIPVGTEVITTLGATTTFSHLEEGDTIAILMEQDSEAILKIWMIM